MSQSSGSLIGVLASGGLDSAILVSHLVDKGYRVQPFYVDSGLHWQRAELAGLKSYLAATASRRLAPLVLLELPLADLYAGHWSVSGNKIPDASTPDEAVYLPGRNLLLAIKPALWCQLHAIPKLALGVLGSNPFDDASDGFFASARKRVIAPWPAAAENRAPFWPNAQAGSDGFGPRLSPGVDILLHRARRRSALWQVQ